MPPGTRGLVLDMHRLISLDNTGLDALEHLHGSLQRAGVRLVLVQPNEQPLAQMARSGLTHALGPGGIVGSVALGVERAMEPVVEATPLE